jgi:hypothetical protein
MPNAFKDNNGYTEHLRLKNLVISLGLPVSNSKDISDTVDTNHNYCHVCEKNYYTQIEYQYHVCIAQHKTYL